MFTISLLGANFRDEAAEYFPEEMRGFLKAILPMNPA
jgi:hypothetical protein